MSKIPLFYHKTYSNYQFGGSHPFDPSRFPDYIERVREDEVMNSSMDVRTPKKGRIKDLELVHSREYIDRVIEMEREGGNLTLDTPVVSGAPDAGKMIVGGSLGGAKVIEEEKRALNLGGLHHAGKSSGEGFCIFNDVAVAAQYLVNQGKKVCVYDTDAHQGNGTMDIFYDSEDVLFISLHQDPRTIYPGRGQVMEFGEGDGKGYTVNVPLPKYSTISDYHYAIEEAVRPIVDQFSPDVLIRNGGSDPHHSDVLTDLRLDMDGLEYLGRTAREMASEADAGHIDLMVSGYGSRTTDGWVAITKGSCDFDIKTPSDEQTGDLDQEPKEELKENVQNLKEIQGRFWEL